MIYPPDLIFFFIPTPKKTNSEAVLISTKNLKEKKPLQQIFRNLFGDYVLAVQAVEGNSFFFGPKD